MTERYFVPHLASSGTFALPPEEARHASAVMRLQRGEQILVFDGVGHEATAEIVAIDRRQVLCITTTEPALVDRERHPPRHLLTALPKGDRQRFLVEKAVELGAASLTPLECRRSVAHATDSGAERLERYVIEASKQCGRTQLMTIGKPLRFEQLREVGEPTCRWIAHPGKSSTGPARDRAAWFAIGPEGGFDPQEIEAATAWGWQPLDLGPRILRLETAALAVLLV